VPSRPVVVLVMVAMCWGVAFAVVKSAVAQVPPAALVAWRFGIAAALVLLVNPGCLRGLSLRLVIRSVALGLMFGTAFLLQTWGLKSTSVVVSAFLTGSIVVLVPLVARVWFRRRLGRLSAAAVGLATAGLALISLRGAVFGVGELLTLAAALLWAIHLVALEAWVERSEVQAIAVLQLVVVAVLAFAVQACSGAGVVVPSTGSAWVAVISLGAFATGAALLLLTWAQSRVDSTTTAVVLTLEPVFGALFGVVAGEMLDAATILGAVAVVVAAVVASRPAPKKVEQVSPAARRPVAPPVRAPG
jgi:drug/metabolite transporter (DMT)-like permease